MMEWVTLYTLATSLDGVTWADVTQPQDGEVGVAVFEANFDQNTVVTNSLPSGGVVARYVRLHPRLSHQYISMRLEFIGCDVTTTTTTTTTTAAPGNFCPAPTPASSVSNFGSCA